MPIGAPAPASIPTAALRRWQLLPVPCLLSFLFAPLAEPGWLGIYLADEPAAIVAEVVPGSPAAKAGLLAGDVLLAIGARTTPAREVAVDVLEGLRAGQGIQLRVQRGEQELELRLVAVGRPRISEGGGGVGGGGGGRGGKPAPLVEGELAPGGLEAERRLGLVVHFRDGRVVVQRVLVGSPAEVARLAPGDVLERAGGVAIRTVEDLRTAVGRSAGNLRLPLRLSRAGRTLTIELAPMPHAVSPRQPAEQALRLGQLWAREVEALRRELATIRRGSPVTGRDGSRE